MKINIFFSWNQSFLYEEAKLIRNGKIGRLSNKLVNNVKTYVILDDDFSHYRTVAESPKSWKLFAAIYKQDFNRCFGFGEYSLTLLRLVYFLVKYKLLADI